MLTDLLGEVLEGWRRKIAVGVIDRNLNPEGNPDNLDVEIDFRPVHGTCTGVAYINRSGHARMERKGRSSIRQLFHVDHSDGPVVS